NYKKSKVRAKRAAGTMHMIDVKTAHLARLLGDETQVRELKARDVDRYIAKRQDEHASNATIGKELTTLRGVLKLASRHEYCEWPEKIMPQNFDGRSTPLDRHIENPQALRKLLASFYDVKGRADIVVNRRAHVLFMIATGIDWAPSTLACREDIDLDAS